MKAFILVLNVVLLAILTIGLLGCNHGSPVSPKLTVYDYEGTFVSDSHRDITNFGWEFEFRDTKCQGFESGKLPSDSVMRVQMECTPEQAHELRLYTLVYNPADPGPYATFSNISWQKNEKGDKYTFIFHVK